MGRGAAVSDAESWRECSCQDAQAAAWHRGILALVAVGSSDTGWDRRKAFEGGKLGFRVRQPQFLERAILRLLVVSGRAVCRLLGAVHSRGPYKVMRVDGGNSDERRTKPRAIRSTISSSSSRSKGLAITGAPRCVSTRSADVSSVWPFAVTSA